ncbi:unnamed protein product (macronuclear) [Paramecium tetraurelia]|uniref:Uncharacterized protein n=1 Tax=Paramecium tetraurelia TaxID=5888 RepID=A0EHL1_PARTE|nr:uncharacterized protein GSPATT00027127001 [Paramecium tetraurelia]CAK94802.1 unnamed protein product [Paramecium tetraurelia]|eukprot:XP_001462175.1 hypothetical protein (macronuclear) [Paramecium tetraurelia strain d4-2]
MIKLLKQFQLIRNTQKINLIACCPFTSSYKQEANIVLCDALNALMEENYKNSKLDILSEYYTKIWEGRLGLVENKILFCQFLENSNQILRKEFAIDKIEKDDNIRINKSLKIFHVFNTITELQIIRWEGIQDLFQWIRNESTYELFQRTNKLHIYLKYIHLLYVNQYDILEFHKRVEDALFQFKKATPQFVDERLEYYNAINMLRQFDRIEKAHLKMTILELSKLENRQIGYSLEQLDILSQYINLVCEVFFPNLLQDRDIFNFVQEEEEEEDDEENNQDDYTLIEPLNRLIRLFLQQDAFYYKRSISSYRDKLVQKEGYVDLVDPVKWRQLMSVSKGLWVLTDDNKHDRSCIDLLENAIFRKLETDTASITDGIQIIKYIQDIQEMRQGHQFLIMKSICDQINNQELQDLSITRQNLPSLLHQMLTLERKAEEFELAFIQPALYRLETWIKEAKFDQELKMCDWYDLSLVIKKHQYNEIEDYVNKKLEQA